MKFDITLGARERGRGAGRRREKEIERRDGGACTAMDVDNTLGREREREQGWGNWTGWLVAGLLPRAWW